jgi:hypothetical protein
MQMSATIGAAAALVMATLKFVGRAVIWYEKSATERDVKSGVTESRILKF